MRAHITQTCPEEDLRLGDMNEGMGHVTHMNESRHAREWVMSHICTRYTVSTHRRISRYIHECVDESNVTQTNESCHADKWVMSRRQMSHVTHMHFSHVVSTHRRGKSGLLSTVKHGSTSQRHITLKKITPVPPAESGCTGFNLFRFCLKDDGVITLARGDD